MTDKPDWADEEAWKIQTNEKCASALRAAFLRGRVAERSELTSPIKALIVDLRAAADKLESGN